MVILIVYRRGHVGEVTFSILPVGREDGTHRALHAGRERRAHLGRVGVEQRRAPNERRVALEGEHSVEVGQLEHVGFSARVMERAMHSDHTLGSVQARSTKLTVPAFQQAFQQLSDFLRLPTSPS